LLGAGHLAYGAPASKPGSWVSPEGSQVAFLRTNEQATDTGLNAPQGGRPQIDLWISNLDGSNSRPLVAGVGTQAPETNLTDIDAVAFSPDGKTLYFDTAAWLTSPAVHSVDIASGKQHLVTNGWLNHVVRAGRYKGDLVVMQHRHFVGSGTYNWYWLFSPDGKELGPIGPTEADPWDVRNLKDFEENDEH
jgi:Tol biopolymer transport system component